MNGNYGCVCCFRVELAEILTSKVGPKIERFNDSILGLSPPGVEFRNLCLEGSVISFITPSSDGSHGSQVALMAQFSLYVPKVA